MDIYCQTSRGTSPSLWVCQKYRLFHVIQDFCNVLALSCILPHCGHRDQKNARRERTQYHFTDGFMQDLQGEVTQCHSCKRYLRVVPIVLLHDQDETRRFAAVFEDEPLAVAG